LEKIPELLDRLGVIYTFSKNRYYFPCPVHGGDNKNGCTIFADERLCWQCWTHSCHNEYTGTIFGLVRGTLTKSLGRNVSYSEVAKFFGPEYCTRVTGPQIALLPTLKSETKRILEEFEKAPNRNYEYKIDRNYAIRNLKIPSEYFLDRNFSSAILTKFDVGDCSEGYMEGRAVTPIFDENYRFVGSAGRAIDNEVVPKWKYDSIIEKGHHLYGLNLSKQYILDSGVCIVAEGQGNIWRLWEAGYPNCVGIMGAYMTDSQLIMLEKSGCTTIVIMTDMDKAGRKSVEQIKLLCGRRFNYIVPEMKYLDPAEHTAKELDELLANYKVKKLL